MGKRTLLIFIHALKTTVVRIMLIHWINQWNIWACIAYSVNFKLQINWSIDWLIDWLIDYLIDRLHVYIRNNYQKISLISYYLNFTGFHLKFPFIRKIISNILYKNLFQVIKYKNRSVGRETELWRILKTWWEPSMWNKQQTFR